MFGAEDWAVVVGLFLIAIVCIAIVRSARGSVQPLELPEEPPFGEVVVGAITASEQMTGVPSRINSPRRLGVLFRDDQSELTPTSGRHFRN